MEILKPLVLLKNKGMFPEVLPVLGGFQVH